MCQCQPNFSKSQQLKNLLIKALLSPQVQLSNSLKTSNPINTLRLVSVFSVLSVVPSSTHPNTNPNPQRQHPSTKILPKPLKVQLQPLQVQLQLPKVQPSRLQIKKSPTKFPPQPIMFKTCQKLIRTYTNVFLYSPLIFQTWCFLFKPELNMDKTEQDKVQTGSVV